jgi:hypothetical protein
MKWSLSRISPKKKIKGVMKEIKKELRERHYHLILKVMQTE